MHVTAIIAAGGRGQRVGGDVPKQLLTIGGRAVLERSVRLFLDHPAINEIVVVLPADLVAEPPPYLRAASKPLRLVAGGARRQDSVANGFAVTSQESTVIVIHDAARPFATPALVTRTIEAAVEHGAAVAATAATDTVKRADPPDSTAPRLPRVAETLPRETVFLAQTPQAFRRQVLREAIALGAQGDATDEATLAERAGHPVRIVEGEVGNIKITTPSDVHLADAIAGRASQGSSLTANFRTGTGYDLHRLVEGRPLVVGGVVVPFERGALGHSDADVVCHAVTDAVLGAAGLGDIGRHFPDTDARWKDASSLDLLARVAALVAREGHVVDNVDCTVVLERPKIKDHIEAMRTAVAGALGVDRHRVSIKGKTNEGMDAVGRGEAIAAHAVALLRQDVNR
jgi:2-C-methyl-D-erythritol 4-phosphate cytidylyltransferase/2-C-methyl-D-erythritol 2,4-cyclodiphosphate synthase